MQVWPEYNYKCPYEREARGDLTTEGNLTDVIMETRDWSDARKGPRFLEPKQCKKIDSFLDFTEGVSPCQHLAFSPVKAISDFSVYKV